jgi:hypothetical protein
MMKILEAERWKKGASPHEIVLLQQQQEEGELPGGKIVEGEDTSVDPSTEHWRAPSRQAAHRDKHPLGLKAFGVN